MAITIYSGQVIGLEAKTISVEVDITPGLHIFSIVGLADKEIQESRERVSAAIKNLGALAPHKKSQRVIVNLAPADIKKEGPAFDLPIAIGYLLASGQLAFDPQKILFLGELGLDGELRKVSGVLPITIAAQKYHFAKLIVPKGNGTEGSLVKGVEVIEAKNLLEVIEYLSGRVALTPVSPRDFNQDDFRYTKDFRDIRGQEKAKRALEIAAAGGHNVLMIGPPGAGKTILAQALPSILPLLSFDESIEVTKIYSVAGLLSEEKPFVAQRPFRNPHHTASYASIIGGGSSPRPGEATLAHRGVLLLDEFPEFDRRVIESLRQPLEEHSVTVARSQGTHTFPAQFICIATMNPCPCGNFGNTVQDCSCTPGAVLKYKKKISGPMLDRIDLHIEVPAVPYEKLHAPEENGESSAMIRARVQTARALQARRFEGLAIHTNSEMGLAEIKKFIPISTSLLPVLRMAHARHRLSARAYHRVLKLARTIADLYNSEEISEDHLAEALNYRPKIES